MGASSAARVRDSIRRQCSELLYWSQDMYHAKACSSTSVSWRAVGRTCLCFLRFRRVPTSCTINARQTLDTARHTNKYVTKNIAMLRSPEQCTVGVLSVLGSCSGLPRAHHCDNVKVAPKLHCSKAEIMCNFLTKYRYDATPEG